MKARVLSFCLWGDAAVYWAGALANARLAAELYPGWECRFHVAAEGVPQNWVSELRALGNVVVIEHAGAGDAAAMLWRFEQADDPDVEILVSRDADSRLSLREKEAVDAWLATGRRFHVMRDHPYHRVAMPGGMWGSRSAGDRQMRRNVRDWLASGREVRKGMDQDFLRDTVWPGARDDCVVHDPFFMGRSFPSRTRDEAGVYFVGECFGADHRPASVADREALREWEARWKRLAWLRRLKPVRF